MWKLSIGYNPLPTLLFEIPETVDEDPKQTYIVSFRFIKPKVISGVGVNSTISIKTVALAHETSRSLDVASEQIQFPYIGVPVKELFGLRFDAFDGRFKGNLDILQDIAYHNKKPYDVIYPEGREPGETYRNHEYNRIFPLYLLHEYIIRLPPTMLITSGIFMAEVFETMIAYLKDRESPDTDEGLSYLFNRLMLERSQRLYFRFLEKHYDSTSVIANVLSHVSAVLENQQRDMLKMQTQIELLTKVSPPVDCVTVCKSIMSLK
jgi:hypothetical protein